MQILITGSSTLLGATLASVLSNRYVVRTLDSAYKEASDPASKAPLNTASKNHPAAPTFVGDPRDNDLASRAAAGCEAVIHLAPLPAHQSSDLELIDSATRGTYNLATNAETGCRFILINSMSVFEHYPMEYRINEYWAPHPTTDPGDLASYLAEITLREVARTLPVHGIVLRMGEVVGDGKARSKAGNPRRLHVDDAVQAVERALVYDRAKSGFSSWTCLNIVGAGKRTRFPLAMAGREAFGYSPHHDLTAGVSLPVPPAAREVKRLSGKRGGAVHRVTIFGAGGPLGAVTAEALRHDHRLCLTDVRALEDIRSPQKSTSPMPRDYGAPHEWRVVDIGDPGQVMEAVRDSDGVINCSVVRDHPVEAFRVNTLGIYNVLRAAVNCGIRRVVQTGPQLYGLRWPLAYAEDFNLPDDVPPRAGHGLYNLTKFLGQEICRIFAYEYDLEVPTLLYYGFINPKDPPAKGIGISAFIVSWQDAGAAMRQALRVPSLPRPFEIFNIQGDLPHGKYLCDKAKRVLGWQPRDSLEEHFFRDLSD